ncbi:unnamed protein product [Ixodes hexagonus]
MFSSKKPSEQSSTVEGPMMSRQKELPKLPLPPLQEVLDRFLQYMEPLLTDQELEETRKVVHEFGKPNGDGHNFYKSLPKKYPCSENWVSDWVTEDLYLKNRGSLVFTSPVMALPPRNFPTPLAQLEHAAKITAAALNFKYLIDRELLEPKFYGSVPLDMTQYKNLFGACRGPSTGMDKVQFTSRDDESSRNVLVIHNNQFFAFNAHDKQGVPFDERKILALLLRVVDMSPEDDIGLGILTTEERDVWAETHEKLRQNPKNAASLEAIRKAAVVVCLDRQKNNPEPYEETSLQKICLGGQDGQNAANRWCDKTVQLIVGEQGSNFFWFEHSSVDGPVMLALIDHCYDYISKTGESDVTKDAVEVEPVKLEFEVGSDILKAIATAKFKQASIRADIKNLVFEFTNYGADFVKSCHLSPDSYVQMALQLAYYKIYGAPATTIESLTTNNFLRGRTDAIYAASTDSLSFCRIFATPHSSMEEKIDSLKKAVEKHKREVNLAKTGFGVLRLLSALWAEAIENGIPPHDLATEAALRARGHITLATTQVSTQCDTSTFLGPIVPEGYCAFYNIRPDSFSFAITCSRTCPETSSTKFKEALEESLVQMGDCAAWACQKL